MKKFALAVVVIIGLGALVLFERSQPSSMPGSPPPASTNAVPSTAEPTPVNVSPPPPPTGNTNAATPVTRTLKDGAYVGDATDAFYGMVQVRTVVQSGRVSSIAMLQQPNDREHSIEISNYAFPILIREAVQKQSAQVDIVSGATQSSEAFVQSLASALAQARS